MLEDYEEYASCEKPKKKSRESVEMRLSKLEKSVTFHSRADTDTNTKLLLCEAECESLKLEITSLKQDIDLVASCFTCVICMRI